MNTKPEKCVFCETPIKGVFELNNPWPVAQEGHCCGHCNFVVVLPARLATMGPVDKGGRIETCSGEQGYQSGNYHYWWSTKEDSWVCARVDSLGIAADGRLFYGPTQDSIRHTIKLLEKFNKAKGVSNV